MDLATFPVVETIGSLQNCASWRMTVEPFLSQLRWPLAMLYGNISPLKIYTQMNPLVSGFVLSNIVAVAVSIIALYSGNFSVVDLAWPFLPTMYTLHFAIIALIHQRQSAILYIFLSLEIIWTARLFLLAKRRGMYSSGAEDYRWQYVRQYLNNPIVRIFFIVVFLAFFQSYLLFLLSAPAYLIMLIGSAHEFGWRDIIAIAMFFFSLLISVTADEQQLAYYANRDEYRKSHQKPKSSEHSEQDLKRGFNTRGLFAYSRHPNYFGELLLWLTLYTYAAVASRTVFNWSIIGWILLVLVFHGSTRLTEQISASKYPEYSEYQENVGMWIPHLKSARNRLGEHED